MKQIRTTEEPTEKIRRVWTGVYKGIRFEIQNWKWDEPGAEKIMERHWKENWTHYIHINLDRQIEPEMRERFWLKGQLKSFREGGPKHLTYDYYDSIISSLEFHGGCTFYEKTHGFEGEDRWIKVGCDYQHYWDEGREYSMNYVHSEVKNTIDSLVRVCRGKILVWSWEDGFYYPLPEEEVKDSFEKGDRT